MFLAEIIPLIKKDLPSDLKGNPATIKACLYTNARISPAGGLGIKNGIAFIKFVFKK